MDGYGMPWNILMEESDVRFTNKAFMRYEPTNQVNFAQCFIDIDKRWNDDDSSCMNKLLLRGSKIASWHQNLLVSTELFGLFLREESVTIMLRAYLTQWDNVTIVVYYGRFF